MFKEFLKNSSVSTHFLLNNLTLFYILWKICFVNERGQRTGPETIATWTIDINRGKGKQREDNKQDDLITWKHERKFQMTRWKTICGKAWLPIANATAVYDDKCDNYHSGVVYNENGMTTITQGLI